MEENENMNEQQQQAQRPPAYIPAAPVQYIKTGSSAWKWIGITIIVCALIGCICFVTLIKMIFSQSIKTTQMMKMEEAEDSLTEVVVKQADTSEKILIINMKGVIGRGELAAYGNVSEDVVANMEAQLKRAGNDENVYAVILNVDSPGGEAFACDKIAELIRNFYLRYEKPVVSCIGSMGASGGYYVSAPCQWIVAHEMSITGSIGVISSSFNYRGLLDKVGVKPVVFKSGRFKDMLSGTKAEGEISAEESQIMQSLIDKMFARFKKVVREGRNQEARQGKEFKALAADWETYADGRVLMGDEAYRLGFVDELGGMKDAIEAAKRLADIKSANLIRYDAPVNWMGLLNFLSETRTDKIQLQLDGFNKNGTTAEMKPGKIYFLPPVE